MDFNTIINRKNTLSLKYDFAEERNKPKDVMAFWVADMDFKAPIEVIEALNSAVNHGIYGYSEAKNEYFEILQAWYKKRFNWDLKNEWLIKTPGVVFSIATAIRGLTAVGDSVLIQTPVYYPFRETILVNNRKLVTNPLVLKDYKYFIDFDDFEKKIIDNNVKLFIMSNPHNPVGRVFTEEELLKIGDICLKHGVLVLSDEIHQDFIYHGYCHKVFSMLRESFQDITITCTSPSKTFNLAGLQTSNTFISNANIRNSFLNAYNKSGYSQQNLMGLIGNMAAYKHGEVWLEELLSYLEKNLLFLKSYIANNMPKVKIIEPEGTYLVWLDFREYSLSQEQLDSIILNDCKLWLDSGTMFGEEGKGFQRINIATPLSNLEEGLKRLKSGFNI